MSSGAQAALKGSAISITEDDDPRAAARKATMWAASGNHYTPCETAVPKLPAGNYRIVVTERGIYFVKKELAVDELLELPDSATEEVLRHMEVFWAREEAYRKFKFLWKRGIFLHGPPGSGKTSTIELLAKRIVDMDGVVVHVDDPTTAIHGLESFRFVERSRKLLLVMEDIDSMTQNRNESALLNLLDGEFQTDNVVVVATTNYPERLDKRITNRPSRFDITMLIDMPSEEARRKYLTEKNERLADPKAIDELEKWVKDSKGFSVAHLKELIIAVEVLESDYPESLKRIKRMMDQSLSSSSGGTLGFN